MKIFSTSFLVLLSLSAAALLNAETAFAAVSLRTETEVSAPIVNLSDVFEGLPDGIDCPIARAPAPGRDITYDVHVLLHLVQQYNLDWKPVSNSDHTLIRSAGSRITNDRLVTTIEDKIKALDVRGELDVVFDNHAPEITVPGYNGDNFSLNNFTFDSISKRFRADLVTEGFSGPITTPLSGHIVIRQRVPILVRRLEAGTIIGAADIDWLSVSEDHLAGFATAETDLIDHELRRDEDADQPIHLRDVMPPRLVTRGSLVTMKIETPYMVVTAQGRALQDGKLGDVVRVNNTQSNRMIEGLVSGAGVVVIQSGQRVAAVDFSEKQE